MVSPDSQPIKHWTKSPLSQPLFVHVLFHRCPKFYKRESLYFSRYLCSPGPGPLYIVRVDPALLRQPVSLSSEPVSLLQWPTSESEKIQLLDLYCLNHRMDSVEALGLVFLRISYLEHKTNDWVRSKIDFPVGQQESLLATVKRRKRAWFGHVTSHDSLSQTTPQGTLESG